MACPPLASRSRSFSRRLFLLDLQKLLPALTAADIERGGAGVRAQAVAPDGTLLDDFRIVILQGYFYIVLFARICGMAGMVEVHIR